MCLLCFYLERTGVTRILNYRLPFVKVLKVIGNISGCVLVSRSIYNPLVLSLQTACIHMVTVDSCFSFNKIRIKKLLVHSLICFLTEGATWGQPYPIHSEWLIEEGLSHTGAEAALFCTQNLSLFKIINP